MQHGVTVIGQYFISTKRQAAFITLHVSEQTWTTITVSQGAECLGHKDSMIIAAKLDGTIKENLR